MTKAEYTKLLFDDWRVEKKGLIGRLLKTYWLRILFVLLMLILPFGIWIFGICAGIWLLNWSSEVNKLTEVEWKEFLEKRKVDGKL